MEKWRNIKIMKNESNDFAIIHIYYLIYEDIIIKNSYIGFSIENFPMGLSGFDPKSFPPLFRIRICQIFNTPIIDVTTTIDIYELNQALNNTLNYNIIIPNYQVGDIYVYKGVYCKQIIFNSIENCSYFIYIDMSTKEIIAVTAYLKT